MTDPQDQGQVTLATIAARLGVSRSTVSNAYNHPDQLSTALRARILETAEELGYTGPDPVARRLRQRRAGAIGVLFSQPLHDAFSDPASVLFLGGVAAAGEEADSGMLLIPTRPSEEGARVITNAIVDGFILYSIPPGHPFVEAATRRHVPLVCVDQTQMDGVAWVGIDDRAAGRQAAQHLVDLGHIDIAVAVYGLTGDIDEAGEPVPNVSSLRLEGYKDAFRSAGIDWNDVTTYECERNTEQAGSDAANALFRSEKRPTALLCTSDVLAIGAMAQARRLGIEVPKDVSVVGFNDMPSARAVGLTTISQPLSEKGAIAARLLLQGEAGPDTHVSLDSALIVRESTSPPPA